MPDSNRTSCPKARRWITPMAWAALGLCAVSCSSTKALVTPSGSATAVLNPEANGQLSDLLQPNEEVATLISVKSYEVQAIRSGDDWVRLFEWFQNQGERAYPKLLEMSAGSHTGAAEFAMSVIAARGDSRLLPYFSLNVPEPNPEAANLYMGYHRAKLAMGDTTSTPVLIDGMEASNPKKRAMAYRALELATHNDIDFDATGTPEARAESIQAWRDWYEARLNDPLL